MPPPPPPPPRFFLTWCRGFLSFLVGAGFLLIIACAGGGGGGGSSKPEARLTFSPIEGGFQIGSQSNFDDLVTLNIIATSESGSVERDISITEFIDGSYDFTGLNDQSSYTFTIRGSFSDGNEQELRIVFVWEENRIDHNNEGIQPGLNTDGDGRADSVDEDDDNDEKLDTNDDCPLIANEDPRDSDGDLVPDDCDIDDDGDGLIEIRSAAELDTVRYVLNGTGRRRNSISPIDHTGCDNNACDGYELVKDIRLPVRSWQPLGQGEYNSTSRTCEGTPFSGRFEGNGHKISSLAIRLGGEDCIGLFGFVAPGSEIRNLIVEASVIEGRQVVGAMIGWGRAIRLSNVVAVADLVNGSGDRVGGLIGDAVDSTVVNARARVDSVRGVDVIGGLIGLGYQATINRSSAMSTHINGGDDIGGLVGRGRFARVADSHAISHNISAARSGGGLIGRASNGRIIRSSAISYGIHTTAKDPVGDQFGGLIGSASGATIIASSAVSRSIRALNGMGGLVGSSSTITIRSSTAFTGSLEGIRLIGGLLGYSGNTALIVNSSALTFTIKAQEDRIGGLVGYGYKTKIVSSYAITNEMSSDKSLSDSVWIGGLVGLSQESSTMSSYAIADSIVGRWQVGGLMGALSANSNLLSSYSITKGLHN